MQTGLSIIGTHITVSLSYNAKRYISNWRSYIYIYIYIYIHKTYFSIIHVIQWYSNEAQVYEIIIIVIIEDKNGKNNCMDISSDKQAKSHKRKPGHASDRETTREK